MKKKLYIVAGMHRSGTSAVTRVINLLGVQLSKDLLPAIPGVNEKGFWESESLMTAHDSYLKAIGSDWADFDPVSIDNLNGKAAARLKEEVGPELEKSFESVGFFAIKDPRVCRFVPVWIELAEAVGVEPVFILPIRHPLEVAYSLKDRDGLGIEAGLGLWLRHVLDAEYYTRHQARGIIAYDDLLADPRTPLMQLSNQLSVEWPVDYDDVAEEIDDFISKGLKHQTRSELSEHASDLYRIANETYEAFLGLKKNEKDGLSIKKLDEIRNRFETSIGFIAGLEPAVAGRFEKRVHQLESQLADEKRNAEEQIRYREKLILLKDAEINKKNKEITHMNEIIEAMGKEKHILEKQLQIQEKQIETQVEQLNSFANTLYQVSQLSFLGLICFWVKKKFPGSIFCKNAFKIGGEE